MENNKEQKVLELKQKLSELRLKHKKQAFANFWKALAIYIGGSSVLSYEALKMSMQEVLKYLYGMLKTNIKI